MSKEFYLAGEWKGNDNLLPVLNPYNQQIIANVCQASEKDLEGAVIAASKSAKQTKVLPSWKRYEILQQISRKITERRIEFAQTICAEAGKPIRFALAEADRAALTFSLAADWVRNLKGEILPLDVSSGSEGKMGIVRAFPLGVVLAISPFNFPLNLVAHKVAPAIATGNAILHKPASKTPLCALMLAEIIAETQWPSGAYSVLPCPGKMGQILVEDPRIHMLSFTGSPEVGWALKSSAGKKKVTLELGGDAAAIVCESADLKDAAKKCALGAFAYAGQVCISIQRIVVMRKVYEEFLFHFRQEVKETAFGDPGLEKTIGGPMIDVQNRDRILSWIAEAKQQGAEIIAGAETTEGNMVMPLALSNISPQCNLSKNEAFAPIVNLSISDTLDEAISLVNASRFGLQAGIFTDSQSEMRMAFEKLEVGGVILNQAPTFRADNMPYGGIKDSGFGREGLEYSIREMTEPKLLVW